MRKPLLALLFGCIVLHLHAQFSLETNIILGGNFTDEPVALAFNPTKTAFFIGVQSNSSDGDVPSNAGGNDFWIMKRDINGPQLWNRTYGGPGNDDLKALMPLPDGGVVAFGTTRSSHGLFGTLSGLAGGWLLRTNTHGDIFSGRIFGGSITDLAVDADRHIGGNITLALEAGSPVVLGQTNNGLFDVCIIQVNSLFDVQWALLLGGSSNDSPVAITTDINGNIYVAANSDSNLPGQTPNQGESDIWIIKIAPDGDILWQKTFGGSAADKASDILFHPDGYIYVTLNTLSTDGDFPESKGLNDIWLLKLDEATGDTEFLRSYGGTGNDFNCKLTLFDADHLAFSATSTSADEDLTGNKGFSDNWIFITDLDGHLTHQMNYGGSLVDQAADIVVVDSIIHVLSASMSIDKNVPSNTFSQEDVWYYTLNTQPDSCSGSFVCVQDSTTTNAIFSPAEDVLVCVMGCTAGYGPGPQFDNGICENFTNSTAYFFVTTDTTADLLTLSVTSHEFNKPQVALLRSVNCTTFQQIDCIIGENGTAVLAYIAIDPLTTYVVAISDAEGNIGQFELCASSIDVEFCNKQDRIFVTQTSMGSPLTGPFMPGEEVQICYELQNWDKLECNGFQGLLPTFGPGWDSTWFDVKGQPIQMDSLLSPVAQGFWAWYELGEVRYNVSNPVNGYSGGQGLPGGWYFTNTGNPPPNMHPDLTTGDISTCAPTADTWKVCFTLKVVDECQTNLDCSITMKTFADGEIGIEPNLICVYDQEERLNLFMRCCLNPTLLPVPDFNVCSGDTFYLQPPTNLFPPVTYSWTADPDPFILGATPGTNAPAFVQILETGAVIPLKVRYSIRAEGNGCFTNQDNFELTVLPTPTCQISTIGPIIVCSGQPVIFNFQCTGTPPFIIGLYRENELFIEILSESSQITIPIDPVFSGRFRVGELRDANCEGSGFGFVNITVNPVGTNVIDTAICEGATMMVGNMVFDEAGSYTINLPNAAENNCDSIVALTLSFIPSLTETISEVICNGDTLFVLDEPYTITTDEIIEYTGPEGCPNYIHLQLLVKDTFSMSIDQTICFGDTLNFEGILVYQAGTYKSVKEIRPGCFEETVLNLNVLPAILINDLAIMGDNGTNTGAILVEILGGTPPFTYAWNSGQTFESLFNIAHGEYSLTVTDRLGCRQIFNFTVPMISGTYDTDTPEMVRLTIIPSLTTMGADVRLYNQSGSAQQIHTADWWTTDGRKTPAFGRLSITQGHFAEVSLPAHFGPGLYFMRIQLEDGSWILERLTIQ